LPTAQLAIKFESFDQDYVQRLTDGDPVASAHFASYFGNLLLLKLRVRLRSPHLIDDIRQETLKRVLMILREGDGVDQPESFGAFVNGVCNNVMREFCRLDEREEPWDDSVDEPMDSTVDLDAELINEDLKREIAWVFAAMPKKDRKILKAIFLDELDKAEVCRKYRVNNSYLRVMLYRAKAQFREAYDRVRTDEDWGFPPRFYPDKE
jgi:RNA polymerase sigma-70 factor (ECF subfamily)